METRTLKREKKIDIPEIGENCPVTVTLKIFGGKWRLLIINYLLTGKKRYGELRRQMPHISEKMLIQELRELEKYDLVARTVKPTSPPTVEYALTEYGMKSKEIVDVIHAWGTEYLTNFQNNSVKSESCLHTL
jgi:DNA-binding HxlR family transcriptional regulator